MAKQTPLRTSLHVDKVDLEDLMQVLGSFFGGARYDGDREVKFPGSGDTMLTVRFDKKGALDRLQAAPQFKAASIEDLGKRISAELLDSTGERVATWPIFSDQPVQGVWEYKGRLRLQPMPAGAPRPAHAMADHPAILEFVYSASPHPMLNARRKLRAATRWTHRLNLLVFPGFKILPQHMHQYWALVPQHDGSLRTQFVQEGYLFEEGGKESDTLSKVSVPEIGRVEVPAYYLQDGIPPGALKLPVSLEASIAAIEQMAPELLGRFDRAAYWFDYATNVAAKHSSSAVALALGAAVEALPDAGASPATCPKCKKTLRGPTKHFKDFMVSHLPGLEEKPARKLFDEFYGLRSKGAHGDVMTVDFLPMAAFMPQRLDDRELLQSMLMHVRLALGNWLLSPSLAPPVRGKPCAWLRRLLRLGGCKGGCLEEVRRP